MPGRTETWAVAGGAGTRAAAAGPGVGGRRGPAKGRVVRVLVTGGVRSGKSRHAEALLAGRDRVTYIAAGPTAADDPDPDWALRLAAHRDRRPASWTTLETRDLPVAFAAADRPGAGGLPGDLADRGARRARPLGRPGR